MRVILTIRKKVIVLDEFHHKLKRVRKEKGVTQKKLGEMIGVSEVMVGQYERGIRVPKFEMRQKIANALQVNITSLMNWDEQYPDIAIEVEKHKMFIAYLKSIGYDVVCFSEGETFSAVMTYEGNNLTLSKDEFYQLQSETKEFFEHQLWKIMKNQEK